MCVIIVTGTGDLMALSLCQSHKKSGIYGLKGDAGRVRLNGGCMEEQLLVLSFRALVQGSTNFI